MSETDKPLSSVFNGKSYEQTNRMKNIYKVIASLLPLEGRDYTVDFSFSKDGFDQMSVQMTGNTDSGKWFADYVSSYIKNQLGKEQ